MYKITLKNTIKHFGLITRHKWYVFQYCCKAGLFWRGIKHDLSKYSPIEFWESVKYYSGNRSPIDNCKAENGVSKAWMHHKGRNSHHYEYWQDNFDNGGVPVQMPLDDAVELVCDYLAAGRAYNRGKLSLEGEWNWWLNKTSGPIAMHPQTKAFVYIMLYHMKNENKIFLDEITCSMHYQIAASVCQKENWEEKFRDVSNSSVC